MKSSLHVVLFFTYGASLKTWVHDGLAQREIQLYRELIKQHNVKVTFLTYEGMRDLDWNLNLDGINVLPIYARLRPHNSKYFKVLQSFLVPWKFRSELKEVDLLKTNQMMGAWVAVTAKFIFHTPMLLRCGYELGQFHRSAQSNLFFRAIIKLVSLISYRAADRIHVATDADRDIVNNLYGIKCSDIQVRPNWIDIEQFTPSQSKLADDKNVLVVGRFVRQKNVSLILMALAGTNIGLELIGAGEQEQIIRREAAALGVSVVFRGLLSNDLMPEYYQAHSIYVICSHYEGNPKTLLEAMSCGCAVVGTNVPGIRNVIEHQVTGLLVPKDSCSLREAILLLQNDPSLRARLGSAARDQIVRENSLQGAVEKEWKEYCSLVSSKSSLRQN